MRSTGPVRGVLCAVLLCAACDNTGQDRILSVDATATVQGTVYFDADGDRRPSTPDLPFAGVRVRLLARGTRDTVARAVSSLQGTYTINDLPVGSYVVVVDTSTLGDTVRVTRVDTSDVTAKPNDSLVVSVAIGYPEVSVPSARSLPLGKKVFVVAVALNGRDVFGDTTVHVEDGSRVAIRATRVRRSSALFVAGDSLRLLGVRRERDGQPTLDDVTVFILGIGSIPAVATLSTATAATAQNGQLDAGLAKIQQATIQDTSTVLGDRILTVDDGSGLLTMVLDKDAGTFQQIYFPNVVIDAVGVLVPTGFGTWRLKPRSDSDILKR